MADQARDRGLKRLLPDEDDDAPHKRQRSETTSEITSPYPQIDYRTYTDEENKDYISGMYKNAVEDVTFVGTYKGRKRIQNESIKARAVVHRDVIEISKDESKIFRLLQERIDAVTSRFRLWSGLTVAADGRTTVFTRSLLPDDVVKELDKGGTASFRVYPRFRIWNAKLYDYGVEIRLEFEKFN